MELLSETTICMCVQSEGRAYEGDEVWELQGSTSRLPPLINVGVGNQEY